MNQIVEYQRLLRSLEQHLIEARRLERIARKREEKVMQCEAESRKWESAAQARQRRRIAELEAEKLKIGHWKTRAAHSQERERRIGGNLSETLTRASLWEIRSREAEGREEVRRNRAWEAYRRAEGLEERLAVHEQNWCSDFKKISSD